MPIPRCQLAIDGLECVNAGLGDSEVVDSTDAIDDFSEKDAAELAVLGAAGDGVLNGRFIAGDRPAAGVLNSNGKGAQTRAALL